MQEFKNEYTLYVDIKRPTRSPVPVFRRGDNAVLKFKIFDDGKEFDLSGFTRGEFLQKLPSGEQLISDGVTLENGFVVYKYIQQEMFEIGKILSTLTIYTGNKRVSIQPFHVYIFDDFDQKKLSYINVLQDLITETQELDVYIKDFIDDITFIEPYNFEKSYKKYNEVLYNGSTYRAKYDVPSGILPTDEEYWILVARKGDDGTGTVSRLTEKFISTEGQQIFTLSRDYDMNRSRIDVFIGGVLQSNNYVELSSNQIKFKEPLPAGLEVIITYFTESIPLSDDIQQQIDINTQEIIRLDNVKIEKPVIEHFVATNGQKVFNLSNSYIVGDNRLRVYIDGVPQYVYLGNYTETSATSITFSEGLYAGANVVIEIIK